MHRIHWPTCQQGAQLCIDKYKIQQNPSSLSRFLVRRIGNKPKQVERQGNHTIGSKAQYRLCLLRNYTDSRPISTIPVAWSTNLQRVYETQMDRCPWIHPSRNINSSMRAVLTIPIQTNNPLSNPNTPKTVPQYRTDYKDISWVSIQSSDAMKPCSTISLFILEMPNTCPLEALSIHIPPTNSREIWKMTMKICTYCWRWRCQSAKHQMIVLKPKMWRKLDSLVAATSISQHQIEKFQIQNLSGMPL
jgi:hypothetical protein